MKAKLSEIAQIQQGYSFRQSVQFDDNSNSYLLQAKNVGRELSLSGLASLDRINLSNLKNPKLIKNGDIVMVSKGFSISSFRASVCRFEDQDILASSTLNVITELDKNIIPEYLVVLLNSIKIKKELLADVSGSSFITTITTSNLRNLEIEIPSLEYQKYIIKLVETCQNLVIKYEQKQQILNNIITNL